MAGKQDLLGYVASNMPRKKVILPIYGFLNNPEFHVLVTNPTAIDIWKKMSKSNLISSLTNVFIFNSNVYSYMSHQNNLCFCLNYHGFKQMKEKGFTEYADERLSSYVNSLRYIMNSSEYVLWDMPVHSMTSGEVVEIYNDSLDTISRTNISSIATNTSLKELFGNYITIRLNGLDFIYSGLQRFSTAKFGIGDRVEPGTVLGHVGCCGKMANRPFLHIECRLNEPALKTNGKLFPVSMINFEPFYQVRLINETRNTPEGLERMRNEDIQYLFNAGSLLSNGAFIRKAVNFK